MCNSVQFISLGPGDPELVTIKALKKLQLADIIFYPVTKTRDGESSRALNILTCLEIPLHKLYPFNVPMSKNRSLAIQAYAKVSNDIKMGFSQNKKIAVVAEGDAGFYSSIHYIYENIVSEEIPVQHIAGIPAFIACGSLAGIHIVKQEEQLVVIPGTTTQNQLSDYLNSGKTIVIMKVSQCAEIIKQIIKNHHLHNYHYFENVGVENKEYYTNKVQEIADRTIPYFSLMIIQP